MYYFVYLTTNLINGKQYVGDHSTNNLNDHYLGSGSILYKAFKKYGIKNFKCKILEHFDTKQQAFDAQEKWINEYKTLTPDGYNISPKGGLGVIGCHSNQTKNKISYSSSGEKNGMFGRKHSEQTKKKWSEKRKGAGSSMYGKKGKDCPNFGKKHSEETKLKWSQQRKGKGMGKKNGMFNNSNFKIWEQKYGKEIAEQKLIERSLKASKSLKGKKRTPEQIENIKKAAKNRKPVEKVFCVYCQRFLDPGNYKRYHGDNCKLKFN